METKTLLALGIVAGIESAYDKWEDFFGNEDKPAKDHRYKESLFEYKERIEQIVKKEAVAYLAKLLSDKVRS